MDWKNEWHGTVRNTGHRPSLTSLKSSKQRGTNFKDEKIYASIKINKSNLSTQFKSTTIKSQSQKVIYSFLLLKFTLIHFPPLLQAR